MAIITTYGDDASTTDDDKFLTSDSSGATKLTPASNINKYLGSGWTIADDSWSYSSYTSSTNTGVINTNSGANTKYQKDMWVKFEQPTLGTKYGKITATATSSITIKFYDGSQLDNEAITNPFFSAANAPYGANTDKTVTSEKLNNTVAFRAYGSAATSIPNSTFTKVNFATEEFDFSSNFASSTFTAPYDGVYHISSSVLLITSSTSARMIATVYVNGAERVRGADYGTNSADGAGHVSAPVMLTAGDTVEIYLFQVSGGSRNTQTGSAFTYFSGYLVGRT